MVVTELSEDFELYINEVYRLIGLEEQLLVFNKCKKSSCRRWASNWHINFFKGSTEN